MRNRLERNHVMAKPDASGTDPTPEEVRAALEHMAASEGFRSSPQLATFLRFIVEAVLRGERGRIKAYTIAVEALGRDERFDPQADPIVRVEATRLRCRSAARFGRPVVPLLWRMSATSSGPGGSAVRRD